MDERAIDDLFNHARSLGYKDSRGNFLNLIYTDQRAFNDMFSYAKSKGFNKNEDDFSILIGKKQGSGKAAPGSGAGPSGGLRLPSNLNKQQVKSFLGRYGASFTDDQYDQIASRVKGKSMEEAMQIAREITTPTPQPVRMSSLDAGRQMLASAAEQRTGLAEQVQQEEPSTSGYLSPEQLRRAEMEDARIPSSTLPTQGQLRADFATQFRKEGEANAADLVSNWDSEGKKKMLAIYAEEAMENDSDELDFGPFGTVKMGETPEEVQRNLDQLISIPQLGTLKAEYGFSTKQIYDKLKSDLGYENDKKFEETLLKYFKSNEGLKYVVDDSKQKLSIYNQLYEEALQNPNTPQEDLDGLKQMINKELKIQGMGEIIDQAQYNRLSIGEKAPIALAYGGSTLRSLANSLELSLTEFTVGVMEVVYEPFLADEHQGMVRDLLMYQPLSEKRKAAEKTAELPYQSVSSQSVIDGLNILNFTTTATQVTGSIAVTYAGGFMGGAALVYGDAVDEALKGGYSRNEAKAYGLLNAGISGYLEKIGLKGITKTITTDAERRLVLSAIRSELKKGTSVDKVVSIVTNKIANSIGSLVKGGTPEGFTEFAQTGQELLLKKAFNRMVLDEGEKGFEEPSLDEASKMLGEAFVVGFFSGGSVPSLISAFSKGNTKYEDVANAVVAGKKKVSDIVETTKGLILSGKVSAVDGRAFIENLKIAEAAKATLPTYVKDKQQRIRAISLVMERNKLTQEMNSADPDLQDGYKKRLNEIKQELKSIADKNWVAPTNAFTASTSPGFSAAMSALSQEPDTDKAARVFNKTLGVNNGLLTKITKAMEAGTEIATQLSKNVAADLEMFVEKLSSMDNKTPAMQEAIKSATDIIQKLNDYGNKRDSVPSEAGVSLNMDEIIGRIAAGAEAGDMDFMENVPEETLDQVATTLSGIMSGADVSEEDAGAAADFLYGRYKQLTDLKAKISKKIETEKDATKKTRLEKSLSAINEAQSKLDQDISVTVKYQQEKALRDEAAGTRKQVPLGEPQAERKSEKESEKELPGKVSQEYSPENMDAIQEEFEAENGRLDPLIIRAINSVNKLLSKIAPNVKIYVHTSVDDYVKTLAEEGLRPADVAGASRTYGKVVQDENKRIQSLHINLQLINDSANAEEGVRGIYHEATHVILDVFFRANPKMIADMIDSIKSFVPKGVSEQLDEFLEEYVNETDEINAEEYISELVDILARTESQLDKPTISKIIGAINDVIRRAARALNIQDPERFLIKNDRTDFIDFLNSLATATTSGLESDIKNKERLQKKYAVQKQTAGKVPVQPRARGGQEVAEGEPEAEPENIAEEGETQERTSKSSKKRKKKKEVGTEFSDASSPQFSLNLNKNLSEDQQNSVGQIFDQVLSNDDATFSETVNIDGSIGKDVPKQKIEISESDNRPEADFMRRLRIPLDFILGKSVGLGMSDTLTTGERNVEVLDLKTNKKSKQKVRDEGGIGYPFKSLMDLLNGKIKKGEKIFGWASVSKGAGTGMITAAKKASKISGRELKDIYISNLGLNKEQISRLEDAIPDNKQYGIVAIYKMGADGIYSNEAYSREAFRQIETLLDQDEKNQFFVLAKQRLNDLKWENKSSFIGSINAANSFIELENILHGSESKMPLKAKASIMKKVFLSSEETESKGKSGNKLGELLKSKGISIESVARAIEEPVMSDLSKGQPVILVAIDGSSKTIEDKLRERHKNYPFGVEGFPIGVFEETTQMHQLSTVLMDAFVKSSTVIVDENAKFTDPAKPGAKAEEARVSIYQDSEGDFRADKGKGGDKERIKDSNGDPVKAKTKDLLLSKLKKLGYVISKSIAQTRYTQVINGSTFGDVMQKLKIGFTSILESPQLTAQQKLVKYLQLAFPGIVVEMDSVEYDKIQQGFVDQKLINKDGKVYGFVKEGRVYLNPTYLNNNTPIHEFGHVWNFVAKNFRPEIYSKGVSLVEGSEYQDSVLQDVKYRKLIEAEFGRKALIKDKKTGKYVINKQFDRANEVADSVADEALAKAIGDKGELFVNEAQKRDFKDWLNTLYKAIKKVIGFGDMTEDQFQNLTLDQFVDSALKEILGGQEITKVTSSELASVGKTSAKFLIAGENANLEQNVLGNLRVANEMEASNQDAKTIRLATGWERGADDKWRYEVQDNIPFLKDTVKQMKEFLSENDAQNTSQKANYFLPKELLKLYPELNDVTIVFNDKFNDDEASYNPRTKTIEVNVGVYPKNTVSALLHEIQHVIQDIEGFAKGGNVEEFSDFRNEQIINQVSFEKEQLERQYKKQPLSRDIILEFDNYINQKDGITKMYNELSDKYDISVKSVRDAANYLYELIGDDPTMDNYVNKIAFFNDVISSKNPFRQYEKLAGEVEARNVQARMEMTPEQRRATTLQETESVPREEQTVRGVLTSKSSKVSSALANVKNTAKALEGKNTFDQQDEKAEVIVGKEKDRWGRSQVWRERIENAGDILRELSGRGNNPDVKYLQEKINKIKNWILDGSGFSELPKSIKTLKDVDESNVRFSSAVDGKKYLDKFHNDVLQETIDAYKGIVVKTEEEQVVKDFILTLLQGDKSSISSSLKEVEDIVGRIKKQGELKSTPLNVSEAYHEAKADGSNPELVEAVEALLGDQEVKPELTSKSSKASSGLTSKSSKSKGPLGYDPNQAADRGTKQDRDLQQNIYDLALSIWDSTKDLMDMTADIYVAVSDELDTPLNAVHIAELIKDLRIGNRPEYTKTPEGKYKRNKTKLNVSSVMDSALVALSGLVTNRRVDKGIIASLINSLKGGPQYTVENQIDVDAIADTLFDIFGDSANIATLQELYKIAELAKGGLRTTMFARIANNSWNKARESKDQQEKLAYRDLGNMALNQLAQEATESGRFNAMIYRIQKLNPEFLASFEKSRVRRETESQMRGAGQKKSDVDSVTTELNTAQEQAAEQAVNSPSVQAAINTATGVPPGPSTPPPAPKPKPAGPKPGGPKPPAPKPTGPPVSEAASKAADARIKDLKGKLKNLFSGKTSKSARAIPAGMNPEILDIITELARNYIVKGFTDRTALISKINGDITAAGGSVTMDYFTEMWNEVQVEAVQQRNTIAANSLANRIVGKVKSTIRESTKTFDPIDELITNLVNKATEDVKTPKKAKESPLEIIKRLVVEYDTAKKIWEASKANVKAKIDLLDPAKFTPAEKQAMKDKLNSFFENDLSYFEIKKTPTASPNATVRNVIKQEMKEKKLKIEEILLMATSKQAKTKEEFIQNIVDDIVNSTGISYSDAIRIAEDFANKYDQIVSKKQESILKRFSNSIRVRNIKKKSQGQRAFEMIKYGVIDPSIKIHDKNGDIIDSAMLLAELFGVPYIDEETRNELDKFAEEIAAAPEGVIRQQVINEMMMFMKMHQFIQLGSLGTRIMTQFYANILTSGDTLLKAFNSNIVMNPFEFLTIATRAAIKRDFALIPLLTKGYYQKKGVGSIKELKADRPLRDIDGYVINQGETYYLFSDKNIMSQANPRAAALSGHYQGLLQYSTSINQARAVLGGLIEHENYTDNITGAVYAKYGRTKAGRAWGRYVTAAQKGLGAIDVLLTAGATGARYSDLLYDAIRFYAKSKGEKIKGSEIVKIINLLQGYSPMVQLDAYNQAIAEMQGLENGRLDLSDKKKKTLLLLRVEDIVRQKMSDRYQQAVNASPWLAGLSQQEIADLLDGAKDITTKIGLMGTPPGTGGVLSHYLAIPGRAFRFSNMQVGAFVKAPINGAMFLVQGNTPLAAIMTGVRLLKSQRGFGLGSNEFFKKEGIRTSMYGKTRYSRQLGKNASLIWNLEKEDLLVKFALIQTAAISLTFMSTNAVIVGLASMFDDDDEGRKKRDLLLKDGLEYLKKIPQNERELMFFGDILSPDKKKREGIWKQLPFYTTGSMYGYQAGGYGKMQSLKARYGIEPHTAYSYGVKLFTYKDNPLLGAFFMEMAASTDAILFNESANLEDNQLGLVLMSTWAQMNLFRDQASLKSISEITEAFAGQRAYEGLDSPLQRLEMYGGKSIGNLVSNLTMPAAMKNINQDVMAMLGQHMDDPKTFKEFVVYRWPIIGSVVIEGEKTGPFGYPVKTQPKRVFPIIAEPFKLPLMLDGSIDLPTVDQLLSTEDAKYTALFVRNNNDKFLNPEISGYYKADKYGDFERKTFSLEQRKKIKEEYKLLMREFAEQNINVVQSPKEFNTNLKLFLSLYGAEMGKNTVTTVGYKRYIINKVMGAEAKDILLDEADGFYNMGKDELTLDKIKKTEEGFVPLER